MSGSYSNTGDWTSNGNHLFPNMLLNSAAFMSEQQQQHMHQQTSPLLSPDGFTGNMPQNISNDVLSQTVLLQQSLQQSPTFPQQYQSLSTTDRFNQHSMNQTVYDTMQWKATPPLQMEPSSNFQQMNASPTRQSTNAYDSLDSLVRFQTLARHILSPSPLNFPQSPSPANFPQSPSSSNFPQSPSGQRSPFNNCLSQSPVSDDGLNEKNSLVNQLQQVYPTSPYSQATTTNWGSTQSTPEQQMRRNSKNGSESPSNNMLMFFPESSVANAKPIALPRKSTDNIGSEAPNMNNSSDLSSHDCSKANVPKAKPKDSRYINTMNALEKAGLLDITLQTSRLIKKNASLQKDIDMLEEIVKVTKYLMNE